MKNRLKIAIQKSGRLNEDTMNLLSDCGLSLKSADDVLKAEVPNFPADILFLRNSDIPQYVEDAVADIAIVGENLLIEDPRNVQTLQKLGFSKCKVSLAVPKATDYIGLNWFRGKKIATSYPNTLRSYLLKHQIDSEIHTISGSVEIAPNIGLADGIFDIVSTGSTLFRNGLKEAEVVLRSEAVLIARNDMSSELMLILEELLSRIRAVLEARNNRYILMNIPTENIDAIARILPGVKSPTVMPLAMSGWSSVHSVIPLSNMWDIINNLKSAGAQGILVIPIEKMVV